MKKIINYIMICLLISILFCNIKSYKAEGETLQDLINDLNTLEETYKLKDEEKKLTEEKLGEITSRMIDIGLRINEIENNVIEIQNKVNSLKEEIEKKEVQIRNLASVLQKNNGDENFYLEFVFDSETLTEFIYRKKIIEQITNYNDRMIEEHKKQIEEVKLEEISLNEEKQKLEEENVKLGLEEEELGLKMNVLDEDARDILEEIMDAKRTVNNYKKIGCKETDLIENCSVIPADTFFVRPLVHGIVTSGYGVRDNPVTGGYQFHAAVDLGGNPPGTSVYASASGVVVLAYTVPNPEIAGSSCGGNHVVIQHKIGNLYYATRYMHLSKVYVTEGMEVTSNDIIGAVGGGEVYDRCSTGAHLDFSIAKGIYGKDFYLFRQPYTVNPFTLVNIPMDGYFNNRYQKY